MMFARTHRHRDLPAGRKAHRARRHSPSGKRWRLIVALVVVLGVAGVWSVWFSGFFTIRTIEFDETISLERRHAVVVRIERDVIGVNALFLDTDGVESLLLKSLRELSALSVSKTWPNAIHISLEVRNALGVWCRPESRDQECFLFDHEAVWGSGIPSTGTLLLTVMDEHPEGAPYPELVDEIFMLSRRLAELDVRVSRAILPKGPLDEIHLMTSGGYPIYFARHGDLGEQLEALEVFYADRRVKGDFSPLYVDARVPGKIYYK